MTVRPMICGPQISLCDWRVTKNDEVDPKSILGDIEYSAEVAQKWRPGDAPKSIHLRELENVEW